MKPFLALGRGHLTPFLFALAAVVATPAAIAAPKSAAGPAVLAPAERAVEGGRTVRVGVPQVSIATTIDAGRIAPNNGGGGLLGAIIIESSDNRRDRIEGSLDQQAEATVRPLRDALLGYDVAALAQTASENGFRSIDWFDARSFTRLGDPETPGQNAAAQQAAIDYRYELSHDFTHIRVIADMVIFARNAPKAKAPLRYRQTIISLVQLPTRSYDHTQNVRMWSADGGKLAKAALALGFERIGQNLPYVLNLDAAQFAAVTDKKQQGAFFAGFNGPMIRRANDGSDGVLFWSKAFIYGETLGAAAKK
jgi:hypothetical protein